MKKIIIFIDNLGSGGAQRRATNIAILLKERGYDVSILIYSDFRFYAYLLEERKIPIIYVKSNNKMMRIVNVCKKLYQEKPDVVISFLEVPNFIGNLSKAMGAKWKLITTESSAKEQTFKSRKNRLFNIFERFSDYKICNSYNALNMWNYYYPQYKDKYAMIYNPVIISNRTEEFVPLVQNNKFKLVIPASYQTLKNPLEMIEAINLLESDLKQRLQVDWYGRKMATNGNTDIYQEAIKRVEKYGLGDVVHLHGETNDIYSIMTQSNAVGLFSTVEGLPNVICEALVLGKMIVMTPVSDYSVLVEGNGILCESMQADGICKAINRLMSLSLEEINTMEEISRKKGQELFSPQEVIKRWIDIIEN